MDWQSKYAKRMERVQPSAIMALVKVLGERQVVNFASGLPDPAGFPVETLRSLAAEILETDWRAGLQYGEAEGYRPLREWVAADLSLRGAPTSAEQVLIVSGSQQGIDLVGRAFLQQGDVVLTEDPSYLAALQVFGSFEASIRPLPMDGQGLDPEAAAAALSQAGVKLLYTMPNHQNPSGITPAPERRRGLLEAAARAGVPVLADEAYLHLRYDAGEPEPLAACDPDVPIITAGTFSKIIAPGMRVAWLAGPQAVIQRLALVKQVTDLHTNSFAQRLVHRCVSTMDLSAHVKRLRDAFREKRDAFLLALDVHLAGQATWTRPAGGMFLLLCLPQGRSATKLLEKALDHGVAYVPGADFFPAGGGENSMRLNFLSPPLSDIDEGVARLSKAVKIDS